MRSSFASWAASRFSASPSTHVDHPFVEHPLEQAVADVVVSLAAFFAFARRLPKRLCELEQRR